MWLQLDRRFLVAALGAAAAILLPVAATLVLSGIAPQVDPSTGWLLMAEEGESLALPDEVRRAVWYHEIDGTPIAVIVRGDPIVAPGQAGTLVGANVTLAGTTYEGVVRERLALIPDGAVLLHPSDEAGLAQAAWLDGPVPGAVLARGGDAFEQLGVEDLRNSFWLLVIASLPATVLVASAFAGQEVRERLRSAATLTALGAPELARRILIFRVLLVAGLGGFLAAAMGGGLWAFGGSTFRPADTPVLAVFLAVALPTLAAAVAGSAVVLWRLRDPAGLLQGAGQGDATEPRIPLPLQARPLTLGVRIVPVILLAAMLFVVDLGFPLAAAQIPAAIAGQGDEWVEGAESDISIGGAVLAGPGEVLRFHPDVEDAIAEIVLPTTLDGRPVLVRGGSFDDLARYHGLTLTQGDASGWVLGHKTADRLGLEVGDVVRTQSAVRPLPAWVPITGIYQASGLLADEAVAPADDARQLADLSEGQASVVRVRPATQESLAAMESAVGRVEVVAVRSGAAVAGGVANIEVDLVNVGGATATRSITVRIDGVPQATDEVVLGGFGTATRTYPVLVENAVFRVEVNPEADGVAQASDVRIEAEDLQFSNQAVQALVAVDGAPVAARNVTIHGTLADARDGTGVVTRSVTDADGIARWSSQPGTYYVKVGSAVAKVQVVAPEFQHAPNIQVEHAWIEGSRVPGAIVQIKAQVTNLGGGPGTKSIDYFLDDGRFHVLEVNLGPGESRVLEASWTFREGTLRVGDQVQDVEAVETTRHAGQPASKDIQSAGAIQAKVADRVLGDARQALIGMATIAMASSLSIVYLSTDRTLRGRQGVLETLHALGEDTAAVRRRAGWEAALLGAVGFLGALLLGKLLFRFLGWIGWPAPFAHSLPDPFGWVFALQAMAAFGAACAMAAFLVAGPLVAKDR